jgi:hypothetical protein
MYKRNVITLIRVSNLLKSFITCSIPPSHNAEHRGPALSDLVILGCQDRAFSLARSLQPSSLASLATSTREPLALDLASRDGQVYGLTRYRQSDSLVP